MSRSTTLTSLALRWFMITAARAATTSRPTAVPRRLALRHSVAAGLFAALPASALIQAPQCISGVGDGCAEIAGDSALLRELQEKSAAKREQRAKEALERYSVNNFGDYFSATFPPKALVRHKDGTFEVRPALDAPRRRSSTNFAQALTQDVVAAGLKEGKIRYGGTSGGVAGFSTTRAPFEFADDDD